MSAPDLRKLDSHFEFGKNWLDYAEKIDDSRIRQATADLQRLAGRERLDGMRFLDIGSGSGLHALAALSAGAAQVVGIDIDPDSVRASRETLSRFMPGAAASFEQTSIFEASPDTLGRFDIVYSWGVLHHTGDMDTAIGRAANLVLPRGALLIALYRRTPFCGPWRAIKRWYSTAPPHKQARARAAYVSLFRWWTRRGTADMERYVREYPRQRGMDFHNDVHDWLGGYPYQSISADRCHKLMASHGFSLEREFLAPVGKRLPGLLTSGCSEFAFRRD